MNAKTSHSDLATSPRSDFTAFGEVEVVPLTRAVVREFERKGVVQIARELARLNGADAAGFIMSVADALTRPAALV